MKTFKKTLALMLAVLVSAPLLAQRYTVTSDRDMAAPLDSYKTYAWAKHVTKTNSLAYAINDLTLKSKIKDAVAHELEALTMKPSRSNPDLLVNFRVFEKPITVQDSDGYFTDAEYWGTDEVTDNRLGIVPFGTSYIENDMEYYMDEGTIMIQLVDAKKGVVVWQGYASGLTDGNTFDRNPDHIAKAVHLIFDKLDFALNQ